VSLINTANVAEKIIRQANMNSITTNDLKNEENYIYLMGQAFINSYPKINCNCSTNKEIENIIKSLKLKISVQI
jgi:hypothetical protein